MTTTDANGIVRYTTSDPVSPLHTLLNLGMQSVSDAVTNQTTIHPVANIAARTALASTYAPTTSRPLYVDRADALEGARLEVSTNGVNWRVFDSRAPIRQWTNAEGVSGWIAHPDVGTLQVTRDGDWVSVQGGLARSGAAVTLDFSGLLVANLPVGFRPKVGKEFPCVSNINHVGWRVSTGGQMRVRAHSGGPTISTGGYVILDGIHWEVA